eukprot:gene719-1384_t
MQKKTTGGKRTENVMGTTTDQKDSIEYIIESPLRFGYLLVFCESEYNSENISFIIDVDNFRDQLLDRVAWPKSWREVDMEIATSDPSSLDLSWPSNTVNQAGAEAAMKKICDMYLIEEAPKEVFSSVNIREKSIKRAKYLALYGPDVFMEALAEPIKILRRDILPRFLTSQICSDMNVRLASLDQLPPASSIQVNPPHKSIIDTQSLDEFRKGRLFTLNEIINCRYMYAHFLSFLEQRLCSENLYCVRMVDEFKELYQSGDIAAATEMAWSIFTFFVASGSTFEVSVSYASRKIIMRSMAKPKEFTFDEIQKSALGMLTSKFESYKQQQDYLDLVLYLRQKKMENNNSSGQKNHFMSKSLKCFGLATDSGDKAFYPKQGHTKKSSLQTVNKQSISEESHESALRIQPFKQQLKTGIYRLWSLTGVLHDWISAIKPSPYNILLCFFIVAVVSVSGLRSISDWAVHPALKPVNCLYQKVLNCCKFVFSEHSYQDCKTPHLSLQAITFTGSTLYSATDNAKNASDTTRGIGHAPYSCYKACELTI